MWLSNSHVRGIGKRKLGDVVKELPCPRYRGKEAG